jgi:Trypsin-co-occurring domain 1
VASLEIETAEGPIFVEIRPTPGLGAVTADPEQVIAKAGESLENSLALVQRIAKAISAKLQDTRARSAEVSFSVKISAKGKFVVAEAAGEAHLQVRLTLDTGSHQSTAT